MVKAYANAKPCWVEVLSETTARVVTPPRDEPTLLHGDVVAWAKASGLRIVERTIQRAHPRVYRVQYAPAVSGSVRAIRAWMRTTGIEGVFVGITSTSGQMHFADDVQIPEAPPEGVGSWTVEALPPVELFAATQGPVPVGTRA